MVETLKNVFFLTFIFISLNNVNIKTIKEYKNLKMIYIHVFEFLKINIFINDMYTYI